MRKSYYILICLLFSANVFAAEKKDSADLMKGNRSSIYFGGSANYLFPGYYTSLYPSKFTVRTGGDILFSLRINRYSQISTGITMNQLNSKSIDDETNFFGGYSIRNTDYTLIGIPILYSFEIPSKKRLFLSIYSGIVLTRLMSNRSQACYDIGMCYSPSTDFINGSKSLFLTSGFHLNFVIGKKIILKTGFEYYYSQFNLFKSTAGSAGIEGWVNFLRFTIGSNIRFDDMVKKNNTRK